MDIAGIETKFADELAALRRAKSPRARKYSPELKKAIVDLSASGVPLEKIRVGLGFSGGAFANLAARFAAKKKQKSDFAPVTVKPAKEPIALLSDALVIELPSGAKIRLSY